jgi:ribosome-associated protein
VSYFKRHIIHGAAVDLSIRPGLDLPLEEVDLRASHSAGPGGQHVNTSDTRVEARFNVASSPSLPDDVRERLMSRLASRLTKDGVIRVVAQEHRSQWQNREAALGRLAAVLRAALLERRPRRPSRPSANSVAARLEAKARRAAVKRERRPPEED